MHYPVNPNEYDQQFKQKVTHVSRLFESLHAPTPELFKSPRLHYRMRVEFRIWHQRDNDSSQCFYAMFDPSEPKVPIRIDKFPVAAQAISDLMQPLLAKINSEPDLNKRLFQIEFLSSTSGDVVVTLVYHRQLDEQWQRAAQALETQYNIAIIGRARKQKIVLSKEYVIEQLTVTDKLYSYEQRENSFTQPNAAINSAMVNWVCNYLANSGSRTDKSLLEMYCGNGNFTLPMARHFKQVLATEISKTSIASAKQNSKTNNVDNIEFVRLSGDETADAINRIRPFRRLQSIDLESYAFSTVFVDPPRSGLDNNTLGFISEFDEIIYISCNPETLASNIEQLQSTHTIIHFALFDQFPYTTHCECGAILSKK